MEISKPLPCIGICGVGQMGTGLVTCFKRAGFQVYVWDQNEARLSSFMTDVGELESWMDRHVGPAKSKEGSASAAELNSLDETVDVLIECVAEDLSQKVELLRRFAKCKNRQAIFLSVTSGLSITEMGQLSGCGPLLVGTHFWNPPHLMPLVEVIPGRQASPDVTDRVCDLVEAIGKLPIRLRRDVPGFIGNRLVHALWREAIHIVEQGIATAEEVDFVAKMTLGLRLAAVGPLENIDLVGLDLVEKIHQYLLSDLAKNAGPSRFLQSMLHEGKLGQKSGQGFYDWHRRDAGNLIRERDKNIVRQLQLVQAGSDTPPQETKS